MVLLHVSCKVDQKNLLVLVNTGASINVVFVSHVSKMGRSSRIKGKKRILHGFNAIRTKRLGEIEMPMCLGQQREMVLFG